MSMNCRVLVVLLLVVLILGGCSTNTEDKLYKKIHGKLTGLESYSCIAEIYTKGNKKPGEFKVKHWFVTPNRYRLEVLEPENMKGKIMVFDGNRLWMYYSYIDQEFLTEDIKSTDEENLFVGFFLRDMLETEKIQYYTEKINGEQVLVIELPSKGENKYNFRKKLFVDAKNSTPLLLEVFDVSGNVTTRVKYNNFEYNPALDPDLFDRDKVTVSMLYEGWDPSSMFMRSLEEAMNIIDFSPLGTGGIPEEFTRDIIQVVDDNDGKVLLMTYKYGEQNFTILQKITNNNEGDFQTKGEVLNLGNRTVRYSETENMRKVSWLEGNVKVDISGNIPRNILTKIAKEIR